MDRETLAAIALIKKIFKWAVLTIIVLTLFFGGWFTIKPGHQGVVLRLGKIDRVVGEGPSLKVPLIERVVVIDTQMQKYEAQAAAYSKDTQTTETKIALNYHIKPEFVGTLYKEIGEDYLSRLIDPAIQEAVKTATAKFTASELIEQRPLVKDEIKAILVSRLNKKYIAVDDFSIVNFQFSDAYEQAIERKQVALQDALASKNRLEQIQYEADQLVVTAKAKAESIRIQSESINKSGGADYINLQWIEAWKSGGAKVPEYVSGNGSSGFIFSITK